MPPLAEALEQVEEPRPPTAERGAVISPADAHVPGPADAILAAHADLLAVSGKFDGNRPVLDRPNAAARDEAEDRVSIVLPIQGRFEVLGGEGDRSAGARGVREDNRRLPAPASCEHEHRDYVAHGVLLCALIVLASVAAVKRPGWTAAVRWLAVALAVYAVGRTLLWVGAEWAMGGV